uniref:Uncharacterized protein n=1 Tax=Amphimedon queenslandica TaxID=400682 RepID=A0A1X7VD39_AMPQE
SDTVMDNGFPVFINTFNPEKSYLGVCIADWPYKRQFHTQAISYSSNKSR